mmetsp:Transcript_51385/g.117155  ORF Transcript_51385/g.117155 Transcript_51385/m.117155 type:complete len:264 (+) Transcript_51385:1157-1948(+)
MRSSSLAMTSRDRISMNLHSQRSAAMRDGADECFRCSRVGIDWRYPWSMWSTMRSLRSKGSRSSTACTSCCSWLELCENCTQERISSVRALSQLFPWSSFLTSWCFSLRALFLALALAIMSEASETTMANTMVPIHMTMMQNTCSWAFVPRMSPKPTVVTTVLMKYKARMYLEVVSSGAMLFVRRKSSISSGVWNSSLVSQKAQSMRWSIKSTQMPILIDFWSQRSKGTCLSITLNTLMMRKSFAILKSRSGRISRIGTFAIM